MRVEENVDIVVERDQVELQYRPCIPPRKHGHSDCDQPATWATRRVPFGHAGHREE
jgi:hypothetical protein